MNTDTPRPGHVPTGPNSAIGVSPGEYFPRRLLCLDQASEGLCVNETEMLARLGPKMILGEPGMGKTQLLGELGRRLEITSLSAVRFMLSTNPAKLITSGKPLLIDGLDEAMARREGDAVDAILAQLEDAGSPEFILSCRSREWQSRTVTNLREVYGTEPTIFAIEPFSREEAKAFLAQRYAAADADHVLDHLDRNGLANLYGIPLTLGLMGQVAESDKELPATRAALFERVCSLIWAENDDDRSDSELGRLGEEKALGSAGAIMAGLLFAGAEAASLNNPPSLQESDVRLADLEGLPGAAAARTVFSSKLFRSVGLGRAKPMHRVIAEFLGARWLARQAMTSRAQRRLLAQLHGSGSVPSSLRGLHAWLAFHSPAMAEQVISGDPFGVLRYGEISGLTAAQADRLLTALRNLAEVDPFFRAQDWDSHTTSSLMIPQLREKIEAIIGATTSKWHLRSLLIEGLKGTALAAEMATTLESIVSSNERTYREREAAAEALLPHRSLTWWSREIAILRDQGTDDSTRLSRQLVDELQCEVDNELLVSVLLAEMGVILEGNAHVKADRPHWLRSYNKTVEVLSNTRIRAILNLLSEYNSRLKTHDWEYENDLADLVSCLILRAIDEGAVGPTDAADLWRWLGMLESFERHYSIEGRSAVEACLAGNDELRRAIQHHVLNSDRRNETIWVKERDLQRRMVGLNSRPDDVAWFLGHLADEDNTDPAKREEWCDLMSLGCSRDGIDPALREASRKFQRGDEELEAFVWKLEHPLKPEWQRDQEREAAKREEARRVKIEAHRKDYLARRLQLRAGKLGEIMGGEAEAFFGR